jgi:hypothetical protein
MAPISRPATPTAHPVRAPVPRAAADPVDLGVLCQTIVNAEVNGTNEIGRRNAIDFLVDLAADHGEVSIQAQELLRNMVEDPVASAALRKDLLDAAYERCRMAFESGGNPSAGLVFLGAQSARCDGEGARLPFQRHLQLLGAVQHQDDVLSLSRTATAHELIAASQGFKALHLSELGALSLDFDTEVLEAGFGKVKNEALRSGSPVMMWVRGENHSADEDQGDTDWLAVVAQPLGNGGVGWHVINTADARPHADAGQHLQQFLLQHAAAADQVIYCAASMEDVGSGAATYSVVRGLDADLAAMAAGTRPGARNPAQLIQARMEGFIRLELDAQWGSMIANQAAMLDALGRAHPQAHVPWALPAQIPSA